MDLDKVLNDFEYSELTDQYVRPSSHNNNNRVKSNDNGTTKHSINNVFHSLNEYLNSDVSDKCQVAVDEIAAETNENLCEAAVVVVDEEEDAQSDSSETINQVSSLPVIELLEIHDTTEQAVEDKTVALLIDETSEVHSESEETIDERPEVLSSEESADHTITETQEISETIEEQGEENPVFGFNSPVEIEEAELNKYLDQLECEFEENNGAVESETTDTVARETIEVEEENKTICEENSVSCDEAEEKNKIRPDTLPLDTSEQKKDINLIGEC